MPPSIITKPFAWNGDFTDPPTAGDNTDPTVSQEVGYPETQSTPLGSGGVPVDRLQTNGIHNLYSSILVYINTGGTFTFDATVVTDLGGYDAGIILWCASAKQFLLSLVNNNTANFITTPSYINDGINWAFLLPDIIDTGGAVSIIGTGGLTVTKNSIFARTAGRGGINISLVSGNTHAGYVGSGNTGAGGANGLVFDDTLSSPTLNNWAAAVGDTINSVATLGAVKRGNPSGSFTSGDWVLQVVGTATFPANPATTGLFISGTLNNANITNGGGSFSLDLVALGVLTGPITGVRSGPASIASGYAASTIGISCSMASSNFLSINKSNLGGTVTSAISFSIAV